MMIENLEHTNSLRCRHHNFGYCKFGSCCRNRHYQQICSKSNCRNDCQARHPILCKYGKTCKFSKRGICAYKHSTVVEDNDALENKMKILQNDNMNLRNKIKVGEIALNKEISKTDQLKSEIKQLERSLKM